VEHPWEFCTRGVDCPWWSNRLGMESCTTGNKIPQGTWRIYKDRESCCQKSFMFSASNNRCNPTLETDPPTKHPTISRVEGDEYEIVPIRFTIGGLPNNARMEDLKEEMVTVLKRILIRLSEKIDGLKVSNVEERVMNNNGNGRRYLIMQNENSLSLRSRQRQHRSLKGVSLLYDVYVVRDEENGKKFGPKIIDYIKRNYGEVMEQVQTSPDINYFNNADVEMNFCTLQNGQFSNCVYNINMPVSSPSSITVNNNDSPTVNKPTSTTIYSPPISAYGSSPTNNGQDPNYGSSPTNNDQVQSDDDENGGLAGWAIFLIILIVLILLCCIGYAIFFCCFRDRREKKTTKEVHNNMYLHEKSRSVSHFDDKSRASSSGYTSRGPRRTAANETNIVLMQQHHPLGAKLGFPLDAKFDDESFTINTYGTSRNVSGRRQGKDPSYYIPGQDDRPDPETAGNRSVASSSNGPPLKAKRDPTMYVEGQRDPSVYGGGQSLSYLEDPPLKPKRDPTMYVEGQRDPSVYFEDVQREPTMYIDGHNLDERLQQEPTMYIDGHNLDERYSGMGAGIADPYHSGLDEKSYRTQDPSVASSKKPKRSKKSSANRKSSKKSKNRVQE